MLIKSLCVGQFGVNCYILGCEKSREGVIIDPGAEAERILAMVNNLHLRIKSVVNTHCHIDHLGAVQEIRDATNAYFYINEADEILMQTAGQQALMFGLPPFTVEKPDGFVNDNDTISFGDEKLTVLETPGHSPGSISLASEGVVFVGDLLFAGSVGRTDLFGGSFDTLKNSIQTKIIPLGEDTVVYCGHGPETTVGREMKSNPFLR